MEKLLLRSNFSFFPQYFNNLLLDFHVDTGTRFSLRDKRLFEISDVEKTKVDCIVKSSYTRDYIYREFHNFVVFNQIVYLIITSCNISNFITQS